MNKYNVLCPSVEEYAKANADPSYCPIESKVGEIEARNQTQALEILSASIHDDKTFPLGSMLQEKVRQGFYQVYSEIHRKPGGLHSCLPDALQKAKELCKAERWFVCVLLVVPDESPSFIPMTRFRWDFMKDEVVKEF